jgi:hypothetical protein
MKSDEIVALVTFLRNSLESINNKLETSTPAEKPRSIRNMKTKSEDTSRLEITFSWLKVRRVLSRNTRIVEMNLKAKKAMICCPQALLPQISERRRQA